MKNRYFIFSFMLVMLGVAGCNKYDKLLRSTDNELKRTKALEYYDKKDYFRALGLLEDILPFYRLTDKGEEIYYKFCYCYYYQKDLYLAGYYFKNFTKSYPGSDKVEECLFMAALCHVELSPPYYLDQADTHDAIRDLQIFINRFPNSQLKDTCHTLLDNMQLKLDTKEFENASLYLKTEQYKAAVVAFNALLEANPGSPFREKVMYMRVEAGYYFAFYSVADKKRERFQEVLTFYTKFAAAYPGSKFIGRAGDFEQKAKHELKLLEQLKNN